MTQSEQTLIWEQPGQKAMIFCPWCKTWVPRDSLTVLQTPPDFPPPHTTEVLKHAKSTGGCGMLFALGPAA